MADNKPTRDFPVAPNLLMPMGCITAGALHALARALEKLDAFHERRGGQSVDRPCLTRVFVVDEKYIYARLHAGDKSYKLQLIAGEWIFV